MIDELIDNNTLAQVFGTVLAGVLIFLTLQRRFAGEEDYAKLERALTKSKVQAEEESSRLNEELERLEGATSADKVTKIRTNDMIVQKKSEVEESNIKVSQFSDKLKELKKAHEKKLLEHKKLKTEGELITTFMISLLSASIISILFLPYLKTGYHGLISSILFAAGVSLLIYRVYFHGKYLD